MGKFYTIKEVELKMKAKELLDMSKISMEYLNAVAFNYCKDMERAEDFARDTFLKCVNDATLPVEKRLDNGLKAIQLLDFAKTSKEAIKFNWQQAEARFKQYNDSILAKQAKENQAKEPDKPTKS